MVVRTSTNGTSAITELHRIPHPTKKKGFHGVGITQTHHKNLETPPPTELVWTYTKRSGLILTTAPIRSPPALRPSATNLSLLVIPWRRVHSATSIKSVNVFFLWRNFPL